MTSKKSLTVFLLLVVCLLLAACQNALQLPAAQVGADAASAPPVLAQDAGTPTATPYQPVAATLTATLSPTPTLPPTPTLTPTPECQNQHGQVERFQEQFSTPQNGYYTFTFRVYTPPCIDQAQGKRYPVLYLIHGQTYADDQWVNVGAADAADALITSGKVRPFFIVMPREDDTFEDIYQASFTTDVTETLVNWIDSRYPTCTDRACRAIGGISRGGAWALRLGFKRWDLYGAVGLHSTPPFIGDPNQFVYWQRDIPAGQMPAVYMDIGRNDPWLASNSSFEKLLTALDVPHAYTLNDGTHNNEYWSVHVMEYLLWYGENWNRLPESTLMGR